MKNMNNEYKQVAALVCIDIDVLAAMAENKDYNLKDLRGFINLTKQRKDLIISNPETREARYNASCAVFSVAVKSKEKPLADSSEGV